MEGSVLFRDYKPYADADVHLERSNDWPPNPEERRWMDARVSLILESYSFEEYVDSRDGLHSAEDWILKVLEKSGVELHGRVLEFGSGNAKLTAILSRLPEVEEVVANDFSVPLLAEIAPRVICALGGHLDKVRFLAGDMHALPELDERFDAIVCYLAVHHLYLPELFFARIANLLEPGGSIVCFREPAIPSFGPFPRVHGAVESAAEHRRRGESEHIYSVDQYARMARPAFSFRLVYMSMFERRLHWLRDRLPPHVWFKSFEIAYVLEKVGDSTTT